MVDGKAQWQYALLYLTRNCRQYKRGAISPCQSYYETVLVFFKGGRKEVFLSIYFDNRALLAGSS